MQTVASAGEMCAELWKNGQEVSGLDGNRHRRTQLRLFLSTAKAEVIAFFICVISIWIHLAISISPLPEKRDAIAIYALANA